LANATQEQAQTRRPCAETQVVSFRDSPILPGGVMDFSTMSLVKPKCTREATAAKRRAASASCAAAPYGRPSTVPVRNRRKAPAVSGAARIGSGFGKSAQHLFIDI